MTPERRKTILIITGTLIIGILIGVLGTGMFARRHYRGDRKEMGRGREGFEKNLMRVIQADSDQVHQLRPILKESMDKIDGIQSHSREEVRAVIDSMEAKVQTILRPEQMERLKKFHEERRKEFSGRGMIKKD
jgi:Spy/CpxP family protein refolding chaperone